MKILIELHDDADFGFATVYREQLMESTVVKSATILTPEQEEAKVIHNVCPKCGNKDVIWTCYCNECKEAH